MVIKIGLETECLDGEDKNSIVYKGRNGTPMFRGIRKEFQCLYKIELEFPCLEG